MSIDVEHQSQSSFIKLLKYIIEEIGIRKIMFSQLEPVVRKPVIIMNKASLDIPLSGRKHMLYASDGEVKDVYLNPGDIHYCPPSHWKWPRWDSPHEMSSVIFYPEYIRITYINYNQLNHYYNSHPADIYYHTSKPMDLPASSISHSLDLMADSGTETGMTELVTALLKVTLAALEADSPQPMSKARRSWFEIRQYVQENFTFPINRAHVASVFNMNPSYISRLFNEQGDESFNAMLRRLRFEHAALLLKKTNMTIHEVTERCGYLSSTYFIAAFQKHYGVPPGKYRG